jgi:transcription elongation factor Elf1
MGGGVEFVCAHCDGKSLRIVKVAEKIVRVECLSCGKESAIQRNDNSMQRDKPQSKSP